MTPKQKALIAALKAGEHVLDARMDGDRRVVVIFPRERGGRSYLTIPEAKRLLARLAPKVNA